MTSSQHGASASEVEVTQIDSRGIWLLVSGAEYFLPYEEYPWFRDARVGEILNVELLHGSHIHWPALDVDLSLDSLKDPAGYPLKYE